MADVSNLAINERLNVDEASKLIYIKRQIYRIDK